MDDENARLRAADALAKAVLAVKRIKETQMRTADYHGEGCRCWRCKEDAMFAALDAYETAALTLTPGKRYLDGHGEVKGPLHRIHWENGEEMLTDSYVVWHPDDTLAGGTREDKRSLVAEVGDAG